jgi:DNA-binding beta-propeller fold protein YncE
MNKLLSGLLLVALITWLSPQPGRAQAGAGLSQVARVSLPAVRGRIDHLAYDANSHRLFVAALGNDTVEVIDSAAGAHVRSIAGLHEPQGLAVVPELNAVAVANGGTGTLQLIDAQTFQTRWTIPVGGDADNVRFDATAKRLFVAAQGGLSAVDPATGKVVRRIAIAGHPESFQLEAGGARVFANLPGATEVVVSDRNSMTVTSRWPMTSCSSNYPMALDESTMRLFVGCRRPAQLAMIDTASGKAVAQTAIVGDTDDLFYDGVRRRLYVIGGEGTVDVLERDGERLNRVSRITTRAGARTGLWVPSLNRLYVALPARGGDGAEVRVFEAAR